MPHVRLVGGVVVQNAAWASANGLRLAHPHYSGQYRDCGPADAFYYRDPPLYCPACEILDRLCGQCAAGLSQALAYVTFGRELGISPEDLADAATH